MREHKLFKVNRNFIVEIAPMMDPHFALGFLLLLP